VMDPILSEILVAIAFASLGAVIFTIVGLISGTDETATISPVTLIVVLLGAPPSAVFAFFIAAAMAKHVSHAIPTTLLGIPGDTMAIPLMREANLLRRLGVPHIALQKMVSSAVLAALIAVPVSVVCGVLLTPFGDAIKSAAPWIFLGATILIAYFSAGRFAAILLLVPFTMLIASLQSLTAAHGLKLSVSFFMGFAAGPLISDLIRLMSPNERQSMKQAEFRRVILAPDVKSWSGYFPNPLKVLDRSQIAWTSGAAAVTSTTFVFSPVALTVIIGEIVGARIKHAYHRLTSVASVRNGVTESTYIAETIIPLIAFGLPLSPVAVGPAWPLFNAPPRFTIDTATGEINNLHTMMNVWEFLGFGLVAVVVAALIAYPFAMRYAHRAASFVMHNISHESIVATFIALIVVISWWEGGIGGVMVMATVGVVGGFLNRIVGLSVGVQFMCFYMAVLTVPSLLKLFGAA
jgi:putative tricarboxylic transport membrane protein